MTQKQANEYAQMQREHYPLSIDMTQTFRYKNSLQPVHDSGSLSSLQIMPFVDTQGAYRGGLQAHQSKFRHYTSSNVRSKKQLSKERAESPNRKVASPLRHLWTDISGLQGEPKYNAKNVARGIINHAYKPTDLLSSFASLKENATKSALNR